MKKMMAGAAVAASLIGISAMAAPQAMAIGDDHGTSTVNGNGTASVYGNSTTAGRLSTQLGLVQGSLNNLCLAGPKANLAAASALILQDINVLSSPQNQQCTSGSSQVKNDEALSHIVDDLSVLSGNGVANR
ncbi:rodlin [Streptomyces kronopolitis]|uniref:rodlin n=1 Tax=Streptomyces kronopolitis TaxID=1612435 RepID=UPI0020BD5734|nr:rodlin [Streptomyces kronopolitis]MCL6301055.1 RdlA protein [Streptomyces kronopolitis]